MAVGAAAFPWQRAVELACYHRVHVLLARNLDDPAMRDLVPADVRAKLLQVRMAAELRNERYMHATAGAFALLFEENIPVLLLKGAALAATVFPPGSRPLNDIDLLIRPEDYGRVARVLEEAQFRKVLQEGRTERETLRDYHEVNFVKQMRNETLSLDVHWRLFPCDRASAMAALGYELPVADLLARATPASLGPARALAPSAEDMFVHIATQIGRDGLKLHLGRLMDLDALVQRGIDGSRLVETATGAGAAGITHLALSLVAMLGGRVPAAALRRLEGACPTCGIASGVLAVAALPFERRALRTAARVVLTPLLFGRPWQRLAYCVSLPLPTAGTWRMHVLRPPHSAADYIRRWRVILLAVACGALLLLQRAAEAGGFRKLAARLRAGLWRPEAHLPAAARPAISSPASGS